MVVPSPSCPDPLSPQAHRVPSVLTATVWPAPAATEAQLVAVPTWTGHGRRWCAVAQLPGVVVAPPVQPRSRRRGVTGLEAFE